MTSCIVLQNSRIVRTDRPHERFLPPLPMKTGIGHSSSFFLGKFSHLIIDKVCHRQALYVFLPLFLLHFSSHSRLFSGERCPFSLRLLLFSTHVANFAQKVVGFRAKTDEFLAKVHKFRNETNVENPLRAASIRLALSTHTFTVVLRCVTALYLRNPTGYSPPAPHNSAHVSHATRHAFQLPFLQSPFT